MQKRSLSRSGKGGRARRGRFEVALVRPKNQQHRRGGRDPKLESIHSMAVRPRHNLDMSTIIRYEEGRG